MTQPQDREALAAEAEEQRQRDQAAAEQDRQEAERRGAAFRDRQAQAEAGIDPASPAGQQAAMRRGDPVQLQGDEGLGGRRQGTNTTHNESLVNPTTPQPGPQGPNFVTGAAGEPVPAGEGVVPERPGVGEQNFTLEQPEQAPEVVQAPYEAGRESVAASQPQVAETPEQRAEREQAEAQQRSESQGAEGPGVTQ